MSNSENRRRVVITGLGALTPIGLNVEENWRNLQAGKSGIGRLSYFDPTPYGVFSAGELKGFNAADWLPTHRLKRLDKYAALAVIAAKQAVEDAGLELTADDPRYDVGVSFGTALGGIANAEDEHRKFLRDGPKAVKKTLALNVFGGSAHTNIAIEYGLRGVATTNSNSCASGPVAIGEGLRYIRDGMANVIIAGACESPLSPLTFSAFALIRTMSRYDDMENPQIACRPFDKNRDGFVMGEGAGAMVLEEYEHAKARNAPIYAELLGYSLNNDGYHMTSPLPEGESSIRVMQQAMKNARINADQIDYINGHASSTSINDCTETLAIKRVFGEELARKIPISGTKAFTAHALGATGAFEAIYCALAIKHGWIPPTLHLETPDPACDLDYVPNVGRELPVKYALSNSFGFGGINSTIVLGPAPD